MRVAMDHDIEPGRPTRPLLVEVVDYPDPPAPDGPLYLREIAGVTGRVAVDDDQPPQPAQPIQDIGAAPVSLVPDLIDAREFLRHVGQQCLHVEAPLRVGDQSDLHRNRSVAGSRSRVRTFPSPARDVPRIRATGTRSSLPITSSAAEASSSTTASSVPCSS